MIGPTLIDSHLQPTLKHKVQRQIHILAMGHQHLRKEGIAQRSGVDQLLIQKLHPCRLFLAEMVVLHDKEQVFQPNHCVGLVQPVQPKPIPTGKRNGLARPAQQSGFKRFNAV